MNKKGIITITIISILAGIIITRQFFLKEKIDQNIKPETNEALAVEVAELFKSNEKLKEEVNKLVSEVDQLNQSYVNSKQLNETLENKIKNYEIILGLTNVSGEGVIIEFNKKVASTQLIDLINSLKNIGVDAINLNGTRITNRTSISDGIFSPPITIRAIGDKNILSNSLLRTGGIIDQIGYGEVKIEDEINISSI